MSICMLIGYAGEILTVEYVEPAVAQDQCAQVANNFESGSRFYLSYSTPDEVAELIAAGGGGGGGSSNALPSPEDAAAAWGIGFVMVVGCYLIARAAGSVVNFIEHN